MKGNVGNLSRAGGRPYTDRPRVYVGCLPCKRGRYVLNIRRANEWLERHWEVCPRTAILARAPFEGRLSPSDATKPRA